MTTMNYLLDGASSACQIDWNAICWTKVEKQVRRLQVRIAKAVREGRHGKAKALQWTLSHSFSAKLIAVRRVTQNKGSKTAGVDKVIWTTPTQKNTGCRGYQTKGLSTSSSQAYLYSQKEWKAASAINSNNGRQGATSTSLVNLGAYIGNVSR